MMEDSKIIELFFSRNEQGIRALSEKYGRACTAIATNILKNERDAAECVNDALFAVWNTVPPKYPDPLEAYVVRMVQNISVTRYRANTSEKRNSHFDIAIDELEGCFADPETVEHRIEARELAELIDRFLDGIDRDSRVMFVRRYWFSDSVEDIGKMFGIKPNNVYVKLSRIRKKLEKYLKEEGYEV